MANGNPATTNKPPLEILSIDKMELYAVAFTDRQSQIHSHMVAVIPEKGMAFYVTERTQHFKELPPEWLKKKLFARLGVDTKDTKKGGYKDGTGTPTQL